MDKGGGITKTTIRDIAVDTLSEAFTDSTFEYMNRMGYLTPDGKLVRALCALLRSPSQAIAFHASPTPLTQPQTILTCNHAMVDSHLSSLSFMSHTAYTSPPGIFLYFHHARVHSSPSPSF